MPYIPKTDWKYNDVLSDKDMNRIEEGIEEGKQHLEVHTADQNNPHGVTVAQIGAETPAGAQTKVNAHADVASAAHKASAIAISDIGNRFLSGDVEGALAELASKQEEVFTSGVDRNNRLKAAIIAKEGTVAGSSPHSTEELVNGILGISTGKKWATGTISAASGGTATVNNLSFRPSLVLAANIGTSSVLFEFMWEVGEKLLTATGHAPPDGGNGSLPRQMNTRGGTFLPNGFTMYFKDGAASKPWIAIE